MAAGVRASDQLKSACMEDPCILAGFHAHAPFQVLLYILSFASFIYTCMDPLTHICIQHSTTHYHGDLSHDLHKINFMVQTTVEFVYACMVTIIIIYIYSIFGPGTLSSTTYFIFHIKGYYISILYLLLQCMAVGNLLTTCICIAVRTTQKNN